MNCIGPGSLVEVQTLKFGLVRSSRRGGVTEAPLGLHLKNQRAALVERLVFPGRFTCDRVARVRLGFSSRPSCAFGTVVQLCWTVASLSPPPLATGRSNGSAAPMQRGLVCEDDVVVAFMTTGPVTEGHVVVVPREHLP